MLNCKQASELASQAMDTALPFGKRLSLKLHLMMCHGCSNFTHQMAFLRKAAKHWDDSGHAESLHLSNEARKRIQEALKAENKP
ncbi:MAG: zf-HC2 domain-containing protein [Methylophilaceae bacterium]|nr:zf-HC2 domain-containing protein [Methylophilaceae bacterium]